MAAGLKAVQTFIGIERGAGAMRSRLDPVIHATPELHYVYRYTFYFLQDFDMSRHYNGLSTHHDNKAW